MKITLKQKKFDDMALSKLLEEASDFVKSLDEFAIDNIIIFFDDSYLWRMVIYYDEEE